MQADPDDFTIDEYNLEKEVSRQSSLTYKYGEAYAMAKAKRDRAKIHLDIARTEVAAMVRKDYDEYGLDTPLESAINRIVEGHKDVVLWKRRIGKAAEQCDILYAAVNAINAKKDAINGQIRLYSMAYYSDGGKPKEPTKKKNKSVIRRGGK